MTVEQKRAIGQMLKKAHSKLTTARSNLAQGYFDDAASRAYYAAFHAISAVLLTKGLHFSSHAQVIGAFNKEFVHTGLLPVTFTRQLQNLFEERQTGDYDFEEQIDASDCGQDLADAEMIVNECENYLKSLF